jgi:hypothetical protein
MAGAEVTREELREIVNDVRDTITEQMARGFGAVNARLDVLNGRVGKGEVQGGEHGVRLVNLEREIFRTGRRRGSRADDDAPGERSSITRRDVGVFVAGIGAVVSVLVFLEKIAPLLRALVTP